LKQVVSSYVLTAVGTLSGLVSVPLALHYLPKSEFALWALMTQMVAYLILTDFGMTPAISRSLIDHKDHPEDGQYGGLIQTGVLVSVTQGIIILCVGGALAPQFADWLKIPTDLRREFITLIRWQCVITAATFSLRILRHMLHAHNRNDVTNYIQTALSGVSLLVLWGAFARGWGVYSVLWSNLAGLAFGPLIMGVACWRLGLFPQRGQWRRPTWRQFWALFNYGKDVLLAHLGSLLIGTSQNFLLANRLGLEAVAAWTVGTKVYSMLSQLLYQVFDYSTPSLSEMMVRGERDRLQARYANLLSVSMALAGVAAVIYAGCNSCFITVWTRGKIVWPWLNDLALALWLLISVFGHYAGGFVLITKRVGGMRFIYFAEGLVFFLCGGLFIKLGGVPAMIAVSIVCSVVFSGFYGLRHGNRYFGFQFPELEKQWFLPLLKELAILVPVAVVLWWVTRPLPALARVLIHASVLTLLGALVFCRYGIPASLKAEIQTRLPARLRAVAGRLMWPRLPQ
jgi:O-antigen/teichoic acid export membrane protein